MSVNSFTLAARAFSLAAVLSRVGRFVITHFIHIYACVLYDPTFYCETVTLKGKHSASDDFFQLRWCAYVLRAFLKKRYTPTIRSSKRSSVYLADKNRPKMKSSVQIIMFAIGEWNFKCFL